jgi:hypothetical protein
VRTSLPVTGSAELLTTLSDFVPDDFINTLLPAQRGSGRRRCFSSAQLWRIHLLALLTPAHTFNAVVELLPEQRAWRRFAHLNHRLRTPDVRMLHEFLLGLKRMFLNSLRLSWTVSLLADAVVLLRALAIMSGPNSNSNPLRPLLPAQLNLPLET